MPEQVDLPVAVINALFDDLLTLQTVLRAEQKTLLMDRHSYVSQVAARLRSDYFAASKAMKPHWPELAAFHNEPIMFFGVSASSYARLIFDLALRSVKVVESLRQGFAETQHGVVSLDGFYSFSRQQTKELRRRFDAEEPFHITGTSANQVREVHQRFGILLVGFRQESAKWTQANGGISSAKGIAENKMKPDGPLKPDGFRLNGVEVWGLVKDWQKTLTFVWERAVDPPKWSDVTTHLGLHAAMTETGFAKFIYKINQHVKKSWPETLQTVDGDVVLRVPLPPKRRK